MLYYMILIFNLILEDTDYRDLIHHYRSIGDYEEINDIHNNMRNTLQYHHNDYKRPTCIKDKNSKSIHDFSTVHQELYDLIESLSNQDTKHTEPKQLKTKHTNHRQLIKCRYCDTTTSNIYKHLRTQKHLFICDEINCGFIGESIDKMKTHLFKHFLERW